MKSTPDTRNLAWRVGGGSVESAQAKSVQALVWATGHMQCYSMSGFSSIAGRLYPTALEVIYDKT